MACLKGTVSAYRPRLKIEIVMISDIFCIFQAGQENGNVCILARYTEEFRYGWPLLINFRHQTVKVEDYLSFYRL